ncbi:MAG: TetR/AcrR family transcriptional regulator [Tannerellaceae bacterium]|jgi:AcrR family transcriptional regulator|nr:TetR/AcrR family transcriptional regulator [Tannerellaceae bacterium]
MKTEETSSMEGRIIEAAKRIFVRKGYEATTMSDIAAEVGISRTAMHYYFRTKDMMFEAIFAQLIDMVLPNIELIMNEHTTILEKLPKVIDQYLAALRNNQMFPLFVVNEMNRDMLHLFQVIAKDPKRVEVLMRFKQQTQDEMDRGLIKPRPLEDIISAFIGLIVFPLLIRNVLLAIFMEGKTEAFDELLNRRKQLIYDAMYHLMAPEEKK